MKYECNNCYTIFDEDEAVKLRTGVDYENMYFEEGLYSPCCHETFEEASYCPCCGEYGQEEQHEIEDMCLPCVHKSMQHIHDLIESHGTKEDKKLFELLDDWFHDEFGDKCDPKEVEYYESAEI